MPLQGSGPGRGRQLRASWLVATRGKSGANVGATHEGLSHTVKATREGWYGAARWILEAREQCRLVHTGLCRESGRDGGRRLVPSAQFDRHYDFSGK